MEDVEQRGMSGGGWIIRDWRVGKGCEGGGSLRKWYWVQIFFLKAARFLERQRLLEMGEGIKDRPRVRTSDSSLESVCWERFVRMLWLNRLRISSLFNFFLAFLPRGRRGWGREGVFVSDKWLRPNVWRVRPNDHGLLVTVVETGVGGFIGVGS